MMNTIDGPFQIVDGNPPIAPVTDQTQRSYYVRMMDAVRALKLGTHIVVKVDQHSDVSDAAAQRALVRNIRVAIKRFPIPEGWHPKVMAMANPNEVSIFRPEVTMHQAMQSLLPGGSPPAPRLPFVNRNFDLSPASPIRVTPASNANVKCIYCRSAIQGRAQACMECNGKVCMECGPTLSKCPTLGCKAAW